MSSKPTNATPKAQSDEEQTGTKRVIRKALIGTGLVTTFDRLCAEIEINALKAQPASVPLAEDEALIADLEVRGDLPGTYASLIRNAAERLSLRSRQLAQALALQRYGLSPHAPECGLFRGKEGAWVRYSELKAAIEGAK